MLESEAVGLGLPGGGLTDLPLCLSRAFTTGTPPAPRYHHSAVVYGSSMFVFGKQQPLALLNPLTKVVP
jgi:hypothetical protein